MAAITTEIDIEGLPAFSDALRDGKTILLRELAKAYGDIGKYDIETLKGRLPGKFNIRAKGLANSFKFKATKPSMATEFSKLFADEYTGWKAARIFQDGGAIAGKGKNLTIIFPAGRAASGRRKYTMKEIRHMIADGELRLLPTPRGVLIVQDIATTLTKRGKPRRTKGAHRVTIGILKRSITEQKRLDFFENAQENDGMHVQMLEAAIENALVNIASAKDKG